MFLLFDKIVNVHSTELTDTDAAWSLLRENNWFDYFSDNIPINIYTSI